MPIVVAEMIFDPLFQILRQSRLQRHHTGCWWTSFLRPQVCAVISKRRLSWHVRRQRSLCWMPRFPKGMRIIRSYFHSDAVKIVCVATQVEVNVTPYISIPITSKSSNFCDISKLFWVKVKNEDLGSTQVSSFVKFDLTLCSQATAKSICNHLIFYSFVFYFYMMLCVFGFCIS